MNLNLNTNFEYNTEGVKMDNNFESSNNKNEKDDNNNYDSEKEENKEQLSEQATVIRIAKEEKTQRCFVYFGVFMENTEKEKNGNNIHSSTVYKTFLKRQLINFSSKFNINLI
jgi:hypothetical protein